MKFVLFLALALSPLHAEWIDLFDGKSTDGWTPRGKTEKFFADIRNPKQQKGFFGVQHHGKGGVVRFRNLRARALAAETSSLRKKGYDTAMIPLPGSR